MSNSEAILPAPSGTPTPEPTVTDLPAVLPSSDQAQAVVEVPDRQTETITPNDTPFYLQPVLLAAIVALIGTLIALWMNKLFHKERLRFEEKLADKKYAHDVRLEERKFSHTVGIAKWHRQSEFAEGQLAVFYEARARLTNIRSPASYSSENNDRAGRDSETEAVRNARDSYYPVLSRANLSSEFFNDFYAARYRAIALFGEEAAAPFIEIWQALHKVRVAASMLMREDMHGEHRDIARNRQRMEERIWEGLAEGDPIAAEIEAAIEKAEALFRPAIINAPETPKSD
ncbi:hypothetical protein [Parasphingorhabdus sp.]|uniref:hypothetical protein n=1 Tax=Parasphingorhabdus sp. TaxID=2709688 RepID=UPI003A924459